jgi:glycerophosphoryl diester phosphodiesterase
MKSAEPHQYTVIEQFLQGKRPNPAQGEDGIVCAATMCAVIDGGTNGEIVFPDGRTPGRVARDVLITAVSDLSPDVEAREAIRTLDQALYDWYRQQGMLDQARHRPGHRVSASAVILSAVHRQIWMIGDCQALVDQTFHTHTKTVDDLLSAVRAFVNEASLRAGKTQEELLREDPGRQTIEVLIRLQRYFQNASNREGGSPYDYHVLDGFLPTDASIKIVELPDEAVDIVLTSDGYPRVYPTLAESETFLQELLEQDPLMTSLFVSTKGVVPGNFSFDDRAYLHVRIPERLTD